MRNLGENENLFSDEDEAMVRLGVGKNMVRAINAREWWWAHRCPLVRNTRGSTDGCSICAVPFEGCPRLWSASPSHQTISKSSFMRSSAGAGCKKAPELRDDRYATEEVFRQLSSATHTLEKRVQHHAGLRMLDRVQLPWDGFRKGRSTL